MKHLSNIVGVLVYGMEVTSDRLMCNFRLYVEHICIGVTAQKLSN